MQNWSQMPRCASCCELCRGAPQDKPLAIPPPNATACFHRNQRQPRHAPIVQQTRAGRTVASCAQSETACDVSPRRRRFKPCRTRYFERKEHVAPCPGALIETIRAASPALERVQRWAKQNNYFKDIWRKRWDSNPRWSSPHAGFQDQSLKPLGHTSIAGRVTGSQRF